MARRIIVAAVLLLLISTLAVAGAGTSGTATWSGNYRVLMLGQSVTNPQVMIAWAAGDTTANLYCGVPSGNPNYPPQPANKSAWVPAWSGAKPPNTMFTLSCTTDAILAATGKQPAVSDLSVMGVTPSTPTAASTMTPPTVTSTALSSSDGTASSIPATATSLPTPRPSTTPVPPTTTPIPSVTSTAMPPMEGMTDGGNTCANLSTDPNAIDQNGVPLNRWAPGLRKGCGFQGFENGDDPMPAGTHLPPPRPFDFDNAVVSNESAFGFKVFYRKGSEAPAGYGGTNGCGDVRVIMHQGGSVHGFTTQFHTVQIAMDQCDTAGNHHILDIAGRINTGCLDLRSTTMRCDGPDRLTADTISCDQKTTFTCATVWYSSYDYGLPSEAYDGWFHFGFLVENPISLYDNASPNVIYPGPGNGSTTMLRDVQWNVPDHAIVVSWSVKFNPTSGVNEVVSAGTTGAWVNTVDPWYQNVQTLEPASGTDHPHPIPGIVYPD